jgi:hypothetical protein
MRFAIVARAPPLVSFAGVEGTAKSADVPRGVTFCNAVPGPMLRPSVPKRQVHSLGEIE